MLNDSNNSENDVRLPEGLDNFQPKELNLRHLNGQVDANLKLLEIRNKDFNWRVDNRGRFGWVIICILVFQQIFVFGLISFAYRRECLGDIQWLFGSFFLALMVQTYFTVNLVIRWLFSEIPYKL